MTDGERLCRCGHPWSTRLPNDEEESSGEDICGVPGCACESHARQPESETFPEPAVFTPAPTPIRELQREPVPGVVKMIEDMLEMAKSGLIVGIVALSFEPTQQRRWLAGEWRSADALWAFEHMKHRLLTGEDLN